MPKIKEVPSSEVHWQVAGLNVKDAANNRVKQYMGADAVNFAPVYVSHNSYYWSDPDPEGWEPVTVASAADQAEAAQIIDEMKNRAIRRMPARVNSINQFFTFPNDDFILVRRREGALEVRLTGWGFANFNRARAVKISDSINEEKLNDITVSFSIDGQAVPQRQFLYARGVDWVDAATDDKGFFNFGRQMPGAQVTVRDKKTGTERISVITPETTNIDVDVTEYVKVRVLARHDHRPVSGESAMGTYGRRSMQFDLVEGVASQTLPWYEGEICTITFRGQSQKRELSKEKLNEFVFETETPRVPHTSVRVSVKDHGEPVAGELVRLIVPGGEVSLITKPDGTATYEFDLTVPGSIRADVRDQKQTKEAIDGTVEFVFDLKTERPVEYDCYVKTVNSEDKPMTMYPIIIQLNSDDPVPCITDQNGLVGPIHVRSDWRMMVSDGNDPQNSEVFTLNPPQEVFVFRLPYKTTPNTGDCSLRVVERNGKPSAGTTCILTQDTLRITAALDNNGTMYFGSDDFDMTRPLKVDLYSPSRTFPSLDLPLDPKEKQYELVEVDGPQPWWKIAGEIALVAGALLGSVGLYFILEGIYSRIPHLFS